MTEYLVLLKLNPGKTIDVLNELRSLPDKPRPGVDLCYTLNVFGTWDVGVWFDAENTKQAVDFVQRKIRKISGVTNAYTLPTFPHGKMSQRIYPGEEVRQKAEKTE